jgi:hypothetical protein
LPGWYNGLADGRTSRSVLVARQVDSLVWDKGPAGGVAVTGRAVRNLTADISSKGVDMSATYAAAVIERLLPKRQSLPKPERNTLRQAVRVERSRRQAWKAS